MLWNLSTSYPLSVFPTNPLRQKKITKKRMMMTMKKEAMIEDPDHGKSETDIIDEITGQMKLF